jgi:hypothetical protein
MACVATISHSVPGRIRVRVDADTTGQRNDVLDAIKTVSARPGIDQIRTDRRTGSALVTYDPDELSIDDAVALLRSAHSALHALAPPAVASVIEGGISDAAAVIRSGMRTADDSVMRATRGTVDLRVLLPIGLVGLSARQLLRNGIGLKSMPWYVLAYYAFDSFIKLHGGPATTNDVAMQAAIDGSDR